MPSQYYSITRTLLSITLVPNFSVEITPANFMTEGEQLILSDAMGAYGYLVEVEESIPLEVWYDRIREEIAQQPWADAYNDSIPSGISFMLHLIKKAGGF